jgi:hypothetical protein
LKIVRLFSFFSSAFGVNEAPSICDISATTMVRRPVNI